MGYVGRGLNQDGGQYRKLDSIESSFDGSEVNFTLKIDGLEVTPTAQNLMISVGGVVQEPGTAFSVSGATITFATAPDEDATFFGVLMGEASFIAAGTVASNEMGVTAGAVTGSKGIVVDSAKNIIGLNNVSASQFEGTFSGALSSSAQIADDISGSFTAGFEHTGKISGSSTSTGSFGKVEVGDGKITTTGNMVLDADGAQIRLEDGGTEFGRISRVSSDLVIKSISNNNDILFKGVDSSATITALTLDMSEAGNASFNNNATFGGSVTASAGTITGDFSVGGTLTAQEVHTEFESASILFTSGSTQFGNSSDDVHDFKGNTISGSATSTGSFGSVVVPGNVDFNGDLDVDGTTNLDVVDIDGAVDMASTLAVANTLTVTTDNENMARFDGLQGNIDFRYGSDIEFDRAGQVYITANNGSGELNFRTGGQNTRMHIDSSGNVGIGTTSPLAELQINGSNTSTDRTSDNAGGEIKLRNTSDTDNNYSAITFVDATDSTNIARLAFLGDDHSGNKGSIEMYTANGGSLARNFRLTNDGEMILAEQGGKVGINTTAPGALLHVSGSQGSGHVALFQRKNGANNTSYMVSIENDDTTSNQGAGLSVRAGNDDGDVTFNATTRDGTYGIRMIGDGRVGIGLDDPNTNSVLHVRGGDSGQNSSSNNTQLTVENNGSAGIQILTGTTNVGGIWVGDSNGSENGGKLYYSNNSDEWTFYNQGSTKSLNISTSQVLLFDNDTGSAGSTLKQFNVGTSNNTLIDFTNVGTMTGIIVSNSHNDQNTGCGVIFTHRASSSGISYITSRNEGSDASSLHFGTRGSAGVREEFRIDKNGDLTANDTSIGSLSDERLKKNIKDYSGGLELIKGLRPVTFEWKEGTRAYESGKTDTRRGLIAQEVLAVDDYFIDEREIEDTAPGYEYVKDTGKEYVSKLHGKDAMYISAIKDLSTEIENLKKRIKELEK